MLVFSLWGSEKVIKSIKKEPLCKEMLFYFLSIILFTFFMFSYRDFIEGDLPVDYYKVKQSLFLSLLDIGSHIFGLIYIFIVVVNDIKRIIAYMKLMVVFYVSNFLLFFFLKFFTVLLLAFFVIFLKKYDVMTLDAKEDYIFRNIIYLVVTNFFVYRKIMLDFEKINWPLNKV